MSAQPRVWAIIGDKLGDNAQIRTVVAALPWPVEEKPLTFWRPFRRGKPWFLPSLYHIDKRASAALAAPWPDLVLTIGRRPAMAALWVKRQSRGRTKLAIFGPPKGFISRFDLIVVPAQYKAPDSPELLRLDLPLMPLNLAQVAAARERFRVQFDHLPKPLTAVLVGGATQPFRFDAQVAEQLVRDVLAATGGQGTLYFTTSRRTQPAAVLALENALPGNALMYRWDATSSAANPYLGLLACADQFVVTGDSVSMLVEVARLGRPLAIFALPQRRKGGANNSEKGRDLTEIHEVLMRTGRAVVLGEPLLKARPADDALPGLNDVVARITGLLSANTAQPVSKLHNFAEEKIGG